MNPSVAIIHYSCPPVIGGVEFVLEAQARFFAERQYPIKAIVGDGGQFNPQVKVSVIPELKSQHPQNEIIKEGINQGNLKPLTEFKKKIEEKLAKELEDVDVIIMHNFITMPFNIALTWAAHALAERFKEKKFIAWVHDSPFFDPSYKPFLATIKPDEHPWKLLKTSNPHLNYVVISQLRKEQLADLLSLDKEQIKVIPNGLNMSGFLKLTPEVEFIFDKFNLFAEDMVALFPARVIKRKNIELAIQIIHALNKQGLKASLVLTGPYDPHRKGEEYFSQLKNLSRKLGIEDKVIFLCEVKDPKGKPLKVGLSLLRDLYLLSDCLLLTSYQEGFGIPLLEAGLCKIPILTSDIRPLPEIGGEEVVYFSIQEEPAKIAQRIKEYFRNYLTGRMFKKVVRKYRWESVLADNLEPLVR